MNLLEEYGIEEDPRFKQAKIEAIRILFFIIAETIWVFVCAYVGTKGTPEDYSYILGMPLWYFWAFLGAGIIFPLIAILLGIFTKDCELGNITDKNSNI